MSIETWKAEFYPIPAEEVLSNRLQHSLTKWIGARKENLNKHGLTIVDNSLCDMNDTRFSITFNEDTCALCHFHQACDSCPLRQVNAHDDVSLNESWLDYACEAEYEFFRRMGNPEPMIELLQSAIDMQQTVL